MTPIRQGHSPPSMGLRGAAFGSSLERERMQRLGSVVEELDKERVELARLRQELDRHLAMIASLERQLQELTPATERNEPHPAPRKRVHVRGAAPEEEEPELSLAQRSYSLSRCEGFRVDAPTGPVGFVEGLRFVSQSTGRTCPRYAAADSGVSFF